MSALLLPPPPLAAGTASIRENMLYVRLRSAAAQIDDHPSRQPAAARKKKTTSCSHIGFVRLLLLLARSPLLL